MTTERGQEEASISDPDISNSEQSGAEFRQTSGNSNVIMFPFMMGAPWVAKFKGGKSEEDIGFQEWLRTHRAMFDMQPLSESQKVSMLICNLEGEARREVLALVSNERRTVEQIITFLNNIYGDTVPISTIRSQFFTRKQRPQENVRQFALALQEFKNRLQNREGCAEGDNVLRDHFIAGLGDPALRRELRVRVRLDPTLTFPQVKEEAIFRAEDTGDTPQAVAAVVQVSQNKPLVDVAKLGQEIKLEVLAEVKGEIKEFMSTLMKEFREGLQLSASEARGSQGANRAAIGGRVSTDSFDSQGRPICRRCGLAGHIERRCRVMLTSGESLN